MLDDAAIFLAGPGKETRHVDKGEDRDFETVTETHEARGLAGAVDVEAAREHHRLVGDDADGLALEPDEAGDDVLGEILLDLEEVALIRGLLDQLLHIVGRVRVFRDQCVEAFLDAAWFVEEGTHRGLFAVVERQEIDEPAHFGEGFYIVFESPVRDRGFFRVR